MQKDQQHIFDKPENVRRLLWILYLACALLLAADLFIHRHAEHGWEPLWGFYALYGFVACVLLVLLAKQLRKLLKRREDYYDR
jgi:membrane protein YdbS with pleckstrin-like domain